MVRSEVNIVRELSSESIDFTFKDAVYGLVQEVILGPRTSSTTTKLHLHSIESNAMRKFHETARIYSSCADDTPVVMKSKYREISFLYLSSR